MKLFDTNVIHTVKFFQDLFGFELPSVIIVKCREKFLARNKEFEYDHNCFNFWFIDVIMRIYIN